MESGQQSQGLQRCLLQYGVGSIHPFVLKLGPQRPSEEGVRNWGRSQVLVVEGKWLVGKEKSQCQLSRSSYVRGEGVDVVC